MFSRWYDVAARPKNRHHGVVPTAQIDWELYELIAIYDSLHPLAVLEIGSQYGGTLWHWITGCESGALIGNIDIFQNMEGEEARRVLRTWREWASMNDCDYQPFIGRSDDPDIVRHVRAFFPDGLDFLFIDACHTYEGAKYDFETYGPLVNDGGIIALHDLITPEFSPHIQVKRLWDEIRRAGYKARELHAGADFGGIGIVYV